MMISKSRLRAGVVVLLIAAGLSSSAGAADRIQALIDAGAQEVQVTATFSADDLHIAPMQGYDAVRLDGGDFLNVPGEPMMPVQDFRVALPPRMRATAVRIVQVESIKLDGRFNIFPAQPLRTTAIMQAPPAFVPPRPSVYEAAAPYPADRCVLLGQADLAGQSFAELRLCPVHFQPATRTLTLDTSIRIVIEGVSDYTCGDYLPDHLSPQARDSYQRSVHEMVVNPSDVKLRTAAATTPGLRGVGAGQYDYVIITLPYWMAGFQPLADWKTQKGVPAKVISTDWIYNSGGYSGTEQEKIRAFVQDAHANWGTIYFLLGGDTRFVPCHMRNMSGEDVANDTYYADYDDDWVCEVHVGRASMSDTPPPGYTTFTNKVLAYEKSPPLTNYAKTAFLTGFDLDEITESELLMESVRTNYFPSGWTFDVEYDSEPGTHWADAMAYLNAGCNLVNHSDHSGATAMGVGYVNHGQLLTNGNMSTLSNDGRFGILYSLGCDPAAFDTSVCIGEAYVRNPSGGGVAFAGNSRYGYYYSGYDTDHLSLRYDRYFFRSLFIQGHYHLGECFSDHKNDGVQMDEGYQYLFTGLTLLGDPELPIWTEDPQTLTVTHDDTLDVGVPTSFAVEVTSAGQPLAGATVCLWNHGDVYLVQQTDAAGRAVFSFVDGTAGSLSVTVTAQNHLPYEGEATALTVPYGDGDTDGDGDVDLADFQRFQQCYGASVFDDVNCVPCNVAPGSTIDLDDMADFADMLAGSGPE